MNQNITICLVKFIEQVYFHGEMTRSYIKLLLCLSVLLSLFPISHTDKPNDVNLLVAVGSPLPRDVRPVTGPFGHRGRPAIEFTPRSYVGRYAKDILPLPFLRDFGVRATVFLQSILGGVLFSVLSTDQRRTLLLLDIKPLGPNNQTLELVYDDGSEAKQTLAAKFVVPNFSRKWTVFSLTVQDQKITLYFNGCERVQSKILLKNRQPMLVDDRSVVFVGRAGWYSKRRPFFVSFNFFLSFC